MVYCNTEMPLQLERTVFKLLGWTLKQLIGLRDVYFGAFTHFLTLEEYRHRNALGLLGDPIEQKYRPGTKNLYEVSLSLVAKDTLVLLPQGDWLHNRQFYWSLIALAEIYDCKGAALVAVRDIEVELRNHDYFM